MANVLRTILFTAGNKWVCACILIQGGIVIAAATFPSTKEAASRICGVDPTPIQPSIWWKLILWKSCWSLRCLLYSNLAEPPSNYSLSKVGGWLDPPLYLYTFSYQVNVRIDYFSTEVQGRKWWQMQERGWEGKENGQSDLGQVINSLS